MKRELAFFLPALLVGVADQLTKLWVRSYLTVGESVPLLGPVRLTHVANPGAVFGLPGHPLVLIALILIVLFVLVLTYRQPYFDSLLLRPVLGMLLGGGVGNLIDRLRLGYVTDFVDLRVWPVFNLADSVIVVGTIALLYFVLFPKR
ncbi:MAG: signal peptidase II [Chloroflexota bacterium]